jgi:hypothetical protein
MVSTSTSIAGHRAARRRERRRYSKDVDRDQAAKPDKNIVDWMSTRADQKIDLRRVVVGGVKAPQQRNFVRPTMAPIKANLSHRQSRQPTRPERQGGDREKPDLTLRAVVAELAEHGTPASYGAVWRFFKHEGITLKKLCTPASRIASTSLAAGPLEGASGPA